MASALHSVPPGSERSSASSMVFSTQATSGWPVTSLIAAATSSATAYPGREESSGFLWNRAEPSRPCARASFPNPFSSMSCPPARSSPQSREARLTSVRVGSTASAAARRVCPSSSASAQPSAVRDRTLETTSVATPALMPSRTSSRTGARRASGMTIPGSRSSRRHTPPRFPGLHQDQRWCTGPAHARTARRERHAGPGRLPRTAASPSPRSGSLTPGAASLTAESTQASSSR